MSHIFSSQAARVRVADQGRRATQRLAGSEPGQCSTQNGVLLIGQGPVALRCRDSCGHMSLHSTGTCPSIWVMWSTGILPGAERGPCPARRHHPCSTHKPLIHTHVLQCIIGKDPEIHPTLYSLHRATPCVDLDCPCMVDHRALSSLQCAVLATLHLQLSRACASFTAVISPKESHSRAICPATCIGIPPPCRCVSLWVAMADSWEDQSEEQITYEPQKPKLNPLASSFSFSPGASSFTPVAPAPAPNPAPAPAAAPAPAPEPAELLAADPPSAEVAPAPETSEPPSEPEPKAAPAETRPAPAAPSKGAAVVQRMPCA